MAHPITDVRSAAWSWVMGSLPPPEDVELHVVCPVFGMREREAHFDYAGAHWHCFRLKRFEPLFLRRRFARQIRPFVRKLKPDVVHGWGGESGCGLVATYLSKRAVVGVQGLLRMLKIGMRKWKVESSPDERGVGYWLRCRMEAMTYRRARRLICESETAQSWLKACYGREADVVAYPLRKEFVEIGLGRRSRSTAEGDLGLGRRSRSRILFVGQDVPRKGGSDAERACEGIATLIRAEGKTAAELVELMGSVDAMIVPSYGDTGPTALKEALSQGVYPIVYDNTGAAELVRRHGFGTTVPTGDVEALRKAVEALDEQDLESRREQGREVAERVREDLTRERAWKGYLDAYARVGFVLPPMEQLQGAVGQRVRHFAKMLALNPFSERVVISFHTGLRPNLVAAVKAKLQGRKVVREINEWPLSVIWGESKLKQWLEIHLLPKLFDGFICISDVLVDFCREHGRKGVPILKVPMTVDVEEVEGVSGSRFQVSGCRL